jgi:cobalt-zinc-cadmium efflux system outer membrane protein
LLHNLELQSFAREVRAREAEMLQARVVPNPTLAAEVEDLAGSGPLRGVGELQLTVRLGQVIELGGKRAARREAARRSRLLAGWDYELKRLDVLSRVGLAFYDVLCAQSCVDQAREMTRLTRRALEATKQQQAAGRVSPMVVSRARLALEVARLAQRDEDRRLAASRTVLAALWNGEPKFTAAVGRLAPPERLPSLAAIARAPGESPELGRWRALVALRRAEVAGQRSRAHPDLELQAGYRYLNGDEASAMVVGLSMPLPLLDRNQGAVRAARHRVERSIADLGAARTRLAVELAQGHRELAAAHDQLMTLGRTVVPSAAATYSTVEEGYRIGRFGYLDLLDTQRTLFEVRRRYTEALARFHKQVVKLERLTGRPLELSSAAPARRRDGDTR